MVLQVSLLNAIVTRSFDAGGQYRPYRGRVTVMPAEELF